MARLHNDVPARREAEKCAKGLLAEKVSWSQLLGRLMSGCAVAREAPERARALWQPLPEALEKLDMLLLAAVVRYRLGELDSNAAGAARMNAARRAITAFGIANPEAYAELLAPLG
jgi:hypothetical protein